MRSTLLLHEKSRRVPRARRTARTRAPRGSAPALHDSQRSASHVAVLPNAALLAASLVAASVGSSGSS